MGDSADDTRLQRLDTAFREAMERRRHGDSEGAETAFRELVEKYADLGSIERQAMVRINIAQLLQQRGALDDAVAEYEQAMRLAESAEDERRVGLCLGGLSSIAMERAQHEQTEALIQKALDIFRRLDDPVGTGNQLGNLGLLRQSQDRLEEAVQCFSEAAELFVLANYAPGAIGVLQCIGEVHRRQGEFDDAETAHRQALDLAEQNQIVVAQAHSHRAIGQILRLRGDLEAARRHIMRGLDLHRRMNDVRGELAALIDLGTIEFALGQGPLATVRLTECIETARSLGMVTPLTKALLNRALYQLDTDQIAAIEADLAEARSLLETLGDPLGWNVWSVTSARVLIRQGNWAAADEILAAELERVERSHLAPSRAPILGLRASVEMLRGNTDRAMTLFEESEANYRGLGDLEGARMALLARIRLLAEAGKLEAAQIALSSLLEAMRRPTLRQPVMEAEVVGAQASLHDLMEDFESARSAALESRRLYTESGFEMALIGAGLIAHQAETNAHRYQGAPLSETTLDDLERLCETAKKLQAPATEVMANCTLADALFVRGRVDEARDLAKAALLLSRKVAFPDGIARALEVLARTDEDRNVALQAYLARRSLNSVVRAQRLKTEWTLTDSEIERALAEAEPDDLRGGNGGRE